MRSQILWLILGATACVSPRTALASEPAPIEARLAAQNALFEEHYRSDLKLDPEFATAIGDYRYNDKLTTTRWGRSLELTQIDEAFLSRLLAVPDQRVHRAGRDCHTKLCCACYEQRNDRITGSKNTRCPSIRWTARKLTWPICRCRTA